MKRITGTNIYSMFKCSRMVALDLHADRKLLRPLRPEEEFLLKRGRDHESRLVAELGWPEPEYALGDFEQGAAQTLAMMQRGVVGISQGVLMQGDQLGIPDLLRREEGRSGLGDHHYVIGDIKSSSRPRGDQILQIAFYSRLLEQLQGQRPEYGYLILKAGDEERFYLAEFDPVLDDLLRRLSELRKDPDSVRPYFSMACDSCRWSEVCLPEMHAGDDLSLVQGMTSGIRQTLESAGIATGSSLSGIAVESLSRRTGLELTLLRRLKKAAASKLSGQPIMERRSKVESLDPSALFHFLADPYEDRILFMGLLWPRENGLEFRAQCPDSVEAELPAFEDLLSQLPSRLRLLHYGQSIPRWHENKAHGSIASIGLEKRFVDMARQLRGAAIFSAPIFGFAEHVRAGLSRDPHRLGRSGAAAMAAKESEGEAWLMNKGRSDLEDLLALKEQFLKEVQL